MLTNNSPLKIYVNMINNRIIMKIKTRYILELLTPEKVLNLEIIEVVIVHYNVVNGLKMQDSRFDLLLHIRNLFNN